MQDTSKVDLVCEKCGKHETGSWMNAEELRRRKMCFICAIWAEKVEKIKWSDYAKKHVVIDSVCYIIGDEKSTSIFRGYAGRLFYIKFFDGRLLTTTNLWCNGDIAEVWRKELPNNAKFLTKNEYEAESVKKLNYLKHLNSILE